MLRCSWSVSQNLFGIYLLHSLVFHIWWLYDCFCDVSLTGLSCDTWSIECMCPSAGNYNWYVTHLNFFWFFNSSLSITLHLTTFESSFILLTLAFCPYLPCSHILIPYLNLLIHYRHHHFHASWVKKIHLCFHLLCHSRLCCSFQDLIR